MRSAGLHCEGFGFGFLFLSGDVIATLISTAKLSPQRSSLRLVASSGDVGLFFVRIVTLTNGQEHTTRLL
jgi:hypothetical protein